MLTKQTHTHWLSHSNLEMKFLQKKCLNLIGHLILMTASQINSLLNWLFMKIKGEKENIFYEKFQYYRLTNKTSY